jgi:hypothetical protein
MRKPKRGAAIPSDGAPVTVDGIVDDASPTGDAGSDGGGNSETISATVDPETVTAEPGQSEPAAEPRRRGRPPGSGAGKSTKAKALPLNVTGLEKLLVGIHGGIAMMSGRMEWALDTDSKIFDGLNEAEFLAKSVKDVSAHYGTVMDQKTLDWCNLIQCCAIVYGGRIYAIRSTPRAPKMRPTTVQENAAKHRAAPPGQVHVTPMPQNSYAPASTDDAGTVEIAGIGAVNIPDDHPMSPNYKPKWNN